VTRFWLNLRRAVSIVAFTACLLFGALWVRSYYSLDWVVLEWPGPSRLIVDSTRGRTTIQWSLAYGRLGFHHSTYSDLETFLLEPLTPPESTGWTLPAWTQPLRTVSLAHDCLRLPHWILMLAAAVIGVAPWLHWRFSIRGVLVLMAFLAAMFAILIFE
jgi:hypothetical protein